MTEDPHRDVFNQSFRRAPTVRAAAPGRVNLIGEHTDYNNGFVLPIGTPQETEVLLAARADTDVALWSANVPEVDQHAHYQIGLERRAGTWVDYVAGVTNALQESGRVIAGFEATIRSDVPLGAGLSSSASLEVAVLRGLNELFGLGLDPTDIARLAHRAETHFVGVPVGVMDQMAASLSTTTSALFIDTQSLTYERLPLPHDVALIVIDSGIAHRHASGEYRARREECEAAARLLGVATLRDVTSEMLAIRALPVPLDRRARHVVTENDRVLQARAALRDHNAEAFGLLMNASHASLRDDFEVTVPAVDRLVSLAQAEPGVHGARMTGGGFGGCIVALARRGLAGAIAHRINTAYNQQGDVAGRVLLPE